MIARTAEMVGGVPSTIRFSYKRVFLRRCAVVARTNRRGLGAQLQNSLNSVATTRS